MGGFIPPLNYWNTMNNVKDSGNDSKKVLLFWSGGKDSTMALQYLKRSGHQVLGLVSTINKKTNEINFHGVKESLLVKQSQILGIPLQRIFMPDQCTDIQYKETLKNALAPYLNKGITDLAFGDIFLEDIRKFKEDFLHGLGYTCHFPLWKKDTTELAKEFISLGHRAIISSIQNKEELYPFLGHEFNNDFLNSLPKDIDPCGENGEFHTFVSFGPGFKMRVPFSKNMGKDEGDYIITHLKDN
jgi:uncharacterized protein (TIGR00290 family)